MEQKNGNEVEVSNQARLAIQGDPNIVRAIGEWIGSKPAPKTAPKALDPDREPCGSAMQSAGIHALRGLGTDQRSLALLLEEYAFEMDACAYDAQFKMLRLASKLARARSSRDKLRRELQQKNFMLHKAAWAGIEQLETRQNDLRSTFAAILDKQANSIAELTRERNEASERARSLQARLDAIVPGPPGAKIATAESAQLSEEEAKS